MGANPDRLSRRHWQVLRQTLDLGLRQPSPAAMSKPPPKPATTPRTEAIRDARLDREAAALRENLRRRKEQARARAKTTKQETSA